MYFRIALFFILISSAWAVLKQEYGGNIRVQEELLISLNRQPLFELRNETLVSRYPVPFTLQDNTMVLKLEKMNPEMAGEIRKAVATISDFSHPCHWILDYPFYDHRHPTSIQLEENDIVITSSDPEYLQIVLTSPCLTADLPFLQPFRRTQFGWEENPQCLGGRPFVDSLTPIQVDPINPVLSLKLGDVDVISVPEEHLQQVKNDSQFLLAPGPRFYVLLKTKDVLPGEAAALSAAIDLTSLSRPIFNEHVEILLSPTTSNTIPTKSFSFRIPSEMPYRLLGERLLLQWKQSGIMVSITDLPHPNLELVVEPILENHRDAFHYLLLKKWNFQKYQGAWFEEWENRESSGQIIPLLVHTTRIAYRATIQNLNTTPDGFPDLANGWIFHP